MAKHTSVHDAWEDDWESLADKADAQPDPPAAANPPKISKAERLAKHAEINRQIWQSADTPETFHYVEAHDNVPLKTEFKPAVKVLSRKPAPKVVTRHDPVTGLAQMTIEDDDEDQEDLLRNQKTAGERRLQAQKEREEKQRKYEEVRARLFGASDTGSGTSTPGSTTPPGHGERGNNSRNRGKGLRRETRRPDSRPGTKELYDPNYTPRPGSNSVQRRGDETSSGHSTPKEDDQIIRTPKGPDSSGTVGFGFVKRGGKAG